MRPTQVSTVLTFLLKEQAVHKIVPVLWGPPGAGKSDVVRQAAAALNRDIIDIRLSEVDASEVKGIDMPDKKTQTLTRYLPQYIEQIKTSKRPVILFFDEFNSGHPSTQPPLYKITNDRTIGDYRLPDNVSIVLAANRETDRAITNKTSAALANRLLHIEFEVNTDDLCNHAIDNKVHHELIAFFRFRPELIHKFDENSKAWPSPRSWLRANALVHSELPRSVEHELLEGIVGAGAAAEFAAFIDLYRDLPSIDAILLNPTDTAVPTAPNTQFAITTALAERAAPDNIDRLFKYINRLPCEFQVVFARDATRRGSKIESSKAFTSWAINNADVLM